MLWTWEGLQVLMMMHQPWPAQSQDVCIQVSAQPEQLRQQHNDKGRWFWIWFCIRSLLYLLTIHNLHKGWESTVSGGRGQLFSPHKSDEVARFIKTTWHKIVPRVQLVRQCEIERVRPQAGQEDTFHAFKEHGGVAKDAKVARKDLLLANELGEPNWLRRNCDSLHEIPPLIFALA